MKRMMTEQAIISQIFGKEWETLSNQEQSIAERIFDWMYNNFGLVGEMATRDRRILAAIQLAVLDVFGESYDEIMMFNRKRDKVDKRAMIYLIFREMSKSSNNILARYMNRDRVTCFYYSIRKAKDLLSYDKDFTFNFNRLKNKVTEIFNELYDE